MHSPSLCACTCVCVYVCRYILISTEDSAWNSVVIVSHKEVHSALLVLSVSHMLTWSYL